MARPEQGGPNPESGGAPENKEIKQEQLDKKEPTSKDWDNLLERSRGLADQVAEYAEELKEERVNVSRITGIANNILSGVMIIEFLDSEEKKSALLYYSYKRVLSAVETYLNLLKEHQEFRESEEVGDEHVEPSMFLKQWRESKQEADELKKQGEQVVNHYILYIEKVAQELDKDEGDPNFKEVDVDASGDKDS